MSNSVGQFTTNNLASDKCLAVKVPLLSRIYIWSVIFEPLQFFVIFGETFSGINGNLSRILQIVVVVSLILRSSVRLLKSGWGSIRFINFSRPIYVNYGIYLSLTTFAGLIGLLSGANNVPFSYVPHVDQSSFSLWLNSEAIRPLFEVVVAFYYFLYFSVLPQYFLRNKASVLHFFKVFKAMFIISFLIGIIGFGFALDGIYILPRHIYDWRMVGVRFNGLAGEPRTAFVYLFLGLSIFILQAHFKGLIFNKWWIVPIIVAALMTKSASGMLGIVAFFGLYAIYELSRMDIRSLLRMSVLCVLFFMLIYVTAIHTERIMMYVHAASGVWDILETGGKLPHLMYVQSPNIYPLYDLIVKIRDLNIAPVLIGSGFGSASFVNNIYDTSQRWMNNPNAQIVRLLFESGLIGTYFFIKAFTHPVKRFTKYLPAKKRYIFMVLTLLLIGCFLGERSSILYIYLGITIAAFRVLTRDSVLIPKCGANYCLDKKS